MSEGVVAILVVAGTVAGVLLGVRVQARKDARGAVIAPAGGRDLWVPASLLALSVAFVGVVMWIVVGVLGQWMARERLFVRAPVREIRVTSADGSVVEPWRESRGFAGATLQVDRAPGGGRGEDEALRVSVDLSGPGYAAAVQVRGEDLPDGVALATVWVYVEDSDAARDAGLHARLAGRLNAGSSGSFSLVGGRTPLKPGEWTQVVWAGSYALELSPALGGESTVEKQVHASERLTSLAVRLDADRPYHGSVFVDDLRLYAAEAAPPGAPR
ncbi:MAG TPA: hypothetical protein VFR81_29200 [Longimicrobium sp.]|nr:hypothetical protein [Longimicrobium sp.]